MRDTAFEGALVTVMSTYYSCSYVLEAATAQKTVKSFGMALVRSHMGQRFQQATDIRAGANHLPGD